PLTSWFTEDGWGIRIHPRIRIASLREIPSATQQLADTFGGGIAAHPQDWHMLQRLWLSDVPAEPGQPANADAAGSP
ncbi:MAG: phosphatidylinositol mannoside acyltransferase, partial [Thermocrispum sp.]